jgi:hypothetical protein
VWTFRRPWDKKIPLGICITETLEIVIPSRAGHFSTLRLLASLQRRNSRFALKPSSLRALKLRGQGA